MTLTLALARDLVTTALGDGALTLLIDAVNADIRRLGGAGYPMRFSGALVDISASSADGADTALTRNFFDGGAAVGDPMITTTSMALVEVSYTLAAIDSGAVTVTLDGESRDDDNETLSALADDELEQESFYLVTASGRIELAFEDAEDADAAALNRVEWELAADRQAGARTVLKEVAEFERIRFVVARPHAGLLMPLSEWEAALTRIAVSCLRIAVTDQGVANYMERGADAQQAIQFLAYSGEYRDRLNQVLALTGNYFS